MKYGITDAEMQAMGEHLDGYAEGVDENLRDDWNDNDGDMPAEFPVVQDLMAEADRLRAGEFLSLDPDTVNILSEDLVTLLDWHESADLIAGIKKLKWLRAEIPGDDNLSRAVWVLNAAQEELDEGQNIQPHLARAQLELDGLQTEEGLLTALETRKEFP